ncbi:C40 family peptidase [Denitrificimonas sp. JX-1]|uniref:C40 family peptidase n=1 Tax=Denitrificimonas halotolerans TaxID=3098930 RepID=A0ABU5GQ74_9GAMM|nr:C40 family peptidase [Denitrificimonas sp. JX-1]MDY7219098.1 C40 family peptidase [Denitrificimonas sp. JX-1]
MSKIIRIIACSISCLTLVSCANLSTELRQNNSVKHQQLELNSRQLVAVLERFEEAQQAASDINEFSIREYHLPALSDSLIKRGKALVGTPYLYGGSNVNTGFDCSGFVGHVFKEELGIELPRTTAQLIQMDAPVIARSDLEPGDLILFNNQGRGRVSHVGIYMGNDQFIHSSSRRSGGVRIDKLSNRYWNASYLQAKRVLTEEQIIPAIESGQLLSRVSQ